MKRAVLALCAFMIVGCSSPSPSAPTTPTPTPTPTPAPPAAPVFPSLAGQWSGAVSLTMAVINIGQSIAYTCNSAWTATQSGGNISGFLSVSASGATNPGNCRGGENFTATVTTAGNVSIPNFVWSLDGVSWNGTPLNDATCGLKAVNVPLAGTVSGRAWNMTQKDSWLCINNTVQVDRTIVVQLTQ